MNSPSAPSRHHGVGWWVKLAAVTAFLMALATLIGSATGFWELLRSDPGPTVAIDDPPLPDGAGLPEPMAVPGDADLPYGGNPSDGTPTPPAEEIAEGSEDDRNVIFTRPRLSQEEGEDDGHTVDEEHTTEPQPVDLEPYSLHSSPGFYRIVGAGGINFREGPNLDSEAIGELSPGQTYLSTGKFESDETRIWIELVAPELGTGWASNRHLERVRDEPDDYERPGAFRITGVIELNLRDEPHIEAGVATKLPANTIVYSTGKTENDGERDWLQVISLDGDMGWASLQYLDRSDDQDR
jgi:hypothetical protein